MIRTLAYRIDGLHSLIGKVLTIEQWADKLQVPNRKTEGTLSGTDISRILGIFGKSWEPDLFRDSATITQVARQALLSAQMSPAEVDAVLIVTCTPYEIMLDQDSFRLLREIGIPDHVVPIQLGAGCAGLARAIGIASQLQANNVLIVSYNVPSLLSESDAGAMVDLYRDNPDHPFRHILWTSPAIFSDAAAALVLRRTEKATGFSIYSRDSLRFGDGPGFLDPLIHYYGGGASRPLHQQGAVSSAVYAMAGDQVKRYYTDGMMLNHHNLEAACPDYLSKVKRIYTHQASPALIAEFMSRAHLPPNKAPTNAAQLGNLVTPCTMRLMHDDVLAGVVNEGEEVCFSVVGAGPERGAFVLPVGPIQTTAQPN